MKTTPYVMTESERAERERVKLLHQNVRAAMHEAASSGGQVHRYALLAWAFVRGLKFRRIERHHHVQRIGGTPEHGARIFEHNMPQPFYLARALAAFFPEMRADVGGKWRGSPTEARLYAWIADPSGAIPAPAPRPKKPYVRPEPIAAEVAA